MKVFKYFKENELNNYEKKEGFLSYAHLFDNGSSLILCNNISEVDHGLYDNVVNGEFDDDDEIFQFYLIDNYTVDILKKYTDELIFYSELLDVYVLGVTHYGTAWEYVLTDIKIKPHENMQDMYVAYLDD